MSRHKMQNRGFLIIYGVFVTFCLVFAEGSERNGRSASTPPLRSSDGELLSVGLLDSSDEDYVMGNKSNYGKKNKKSDQSVSYLPDDYNKLEIPQSEHGNGVFVEVSIFIRKILEINERKQELLLDTDVGMQWIDWQIYEHLKKNQLKNPITGKLKKNLTLDSELLKDIWKPDVFIDEMAAVEKTSLLSKLITLKFLGDAGHYTGDIVYSSRSSLRLRCAMDFKYYPADTQTCYYHLRSYSYNLEELSLRWMNPTGIFLDDSTDANFDLQIASLEPKIRYKDLYIVEKFNRFRAGKYAALQFVIKTRRKLSYHLTQTYLPSVLIIMITWLCFLLPSDMVEARIGISMTTNLTLTAMFAAVRGQSPIVSYTMAIDIWMVFCIFFVFIALLLFIVIYWMKLRLAKFKAISQIKRNLHKLSTKAERGAENEDADTERDADIEECELSSLTDRKTYDYLVTFTKRYAFWVFATIFLVFLISYWSWLLHSSEYLEWNPNPKYNAMSEFEVNEGEIEEDDNLYLYQGIVKTPFDSMITNDKGAILNHNSRRN